MSMANGAIRPAGESYRTELSQGIYRDNGHPALNDFLAPTLGYLVYQEQIIEFYISFVDLQWVKPMSLEDILVRKQEQRLISLL